MFEFLSRLSFNKGTNIAFIIFGLIVAPFWFLFQFVPNIYTSNDLVTLLLLSICSILPIAIIEYLIFYSFVSLEKYESDAIRDAHRFSTIGLVCLWCGLVFYIPSAGKFFFRTITQQDAIISIIWVHTIVVGGIIVGEIGERLFFNIRKMLKNKKT